ncbi:c-type cytochrome biogenesis protein CcmI [Paracoccus aerius]
MFWIICAALTAAVGLAIMAPLMRARATAAQPAAAFDLRVYRDQLREVDRDLERGVISAEDAARLRTEIGRKVLEADRRLSQAAPEGKDGRGLLALGVLALLFMAAVTLYLREGQPGRGDLPIAQRIAQSEQAYASRPSQAEAEARAPAPAPAEIPDDFAALIQQLREAVARNPDDPQGLALLAQNELRVGNPAAAREAQQRLVDLRGEDARPRIWCAFRP